MYEDKDGSKHNYFGNSTYAEAPHEMIRASKNVVADVHEIRFYRDSRRLWAVQEFMK